MSNEKGFTLIELVMVIVILGILAAVAIPRFSDLATQAKKSAVNGMYGSVQGAAAMVHAQSLIEGEAGASSASVTLEGTAVATVYGYPAVASIDDAMSAYDGFTFNAAVAPAASDFTLTSDGATADCKVTYAEPTGANARPTIGKTTTCD